MGERGDGERGQSFRGNYVVLVVEVSVTRIKGFTRLLRGKRRPDPVTGRYTRCKLTVQNG